MEWIGLYKLARLAFLAVTLVGDRPSGSSPSRAGSASRRPRSACSSTTTSRRSPAMTRAPRDRRARERAGRRAARRDRRARQHDPALVQRRLLRRDRARRDLHPLLQLLGLVAASASTTPRPACAPSGSRPLRAAAPPRADARIPTAATPPPSPKGKQVFETICVACHLADGRGLVGPEPRRSLLEVRARRRRPVPDRLGRAARRHAALGSRSSGPRRSGRCSPTSRRCRARPRRASARPDYQAPPAGGGGR